MRVGGRGEECRFFCRLCLPIITAGIMSDFALSTLITAEGLSARSRGCGREEAYSVLMFGSAVAKIRTIRNSDSCEYLLSLRNLVIVPSKRMAVFSRV